MLILAMDIIDKLNLFLGLGCKMSVEGESCAIAVPYMQYRSACTFFKVIRCLLYTLTAILHTLLPSPPDHVVQQ